MTLLLYRYRENIEIRDEVTGIKPTIKISDAGLIFLQTAFQINTEEKDQFSSYRNTETQEVVPCGSTAEEVSFQW